jgi:hypothetical protein
MTALELITNAIWKSMPACPGKLASSDDAALGLSKLNRLLDNWNAESLFIYGTTLSDFTLTINHNPHTIGVSGSGADFIVTTARPPKIEAAALILTDQTPNIYSPLEIVDGDWWINNPTPDVSNSSSLLSLPELLMAPGSDLSLAGSDNRLWDQIEAVDAALAIGID